MYTAKLRELKPGMVLAENVKNMQGILLLTKGISLNNKNIWMLKSWGVTEVFLEGEADKEENFSQLQEDQKKAIEKELKKRFSETLGNEVMVELMRVSAIQLHKRLLKEKEK